MSLDLQAWNEQFGGDEGVDPFAKRGNSSFNFALERTYKVKVTKATIVSSQRGDTQLRLACDLFGSNHEDAEKLGDCLEHITLPWQDSDRDYDKAKVEKMTSRRMQDVQTMLRAAAPATYGIYAERKTEGGKTRYLDFDGNVMSPTEYKDREAAVQKKVIDVILAWHSDEDTTVDLLTDATLYVVKVANRDKPKYPYTNWSTYQPTKYGMVGEPGVSL